MCGFAGYPATMEQALQRERQGKFQGGESILLYLYLLILAEGWWGVLRIESGGDGTGGVSGWGALPLSYIPETFYFLF